MRIGQIAQATSLPIETLRYWEKEALLSPKVDQHNGYRHYSAQDLQQVHFIQGAKAVGFSLNEIRDLLALRVNAENYTCSDVKGVALKKLGAIDEKIARLQIMRDALHDITTICCGGQEPARDCTILSKLHSAEPDERTV